LTDKQLVARVKSGFQKIREQLPYILELRRRFAELPRRKANIDGCHSWREFCERRLNRTYQQIYNVLAEAQAETITVTVKESPAAHHPEQKVLVRTLPSLVQKPRFAAVTTIDELDDAYQREHTIPLTRPPSFRATSLRLSACSMKQRERLSG
jgi:hypothetical protein